MFKRKKDKEPEEIEEVEGEEEEEFQDPRLVITIPEDDPVDPESTYSMEDIVRRWECSHAQIKREMEVGLPMYQNRNGKWRIKGEDIIAWETKVEAYREDIEKEKKRTKRNNLIAYIIGGAIVAGCGIAALTMFTNV